MANANLVVLVGNVTRDPQLKYLPNQTAVCEFGMAMNRKFKGANGEDREEVTFVDCAVFGKAAETLSKYVTKGKPLYVQGRLKYDSWEDKNGGGKRSKLSVIVDNFQFIGARDARNGGDGDEGEAPSTSKGNWQGADLPARKPQKTPPKDPFGTEMEFQESDIPFD